MPKEAEGDENLYKHVVHEILPLPCFDFDLALSSTHISLTMSQGGFAAKPSLL